MSRRQYQARNSGAMEWKAKDPSPVVAAEQSSSANGRYSMPEMVFVPYLAQDDARINASAKEIVDHLNRELSRLLRMKSSNFWQQVSSNKSLHEFLESYLLVRRRWYDLNRHAEDVSGEDDLSRRVFMVLLRMCSDETPGGSSSVISGPAKFHVKDTFSVPKLLNVCAIFGRDNAELTRRLVSTVLNSQSSYLGVLPDIARQILATINGTLETFTLRTNKSDDVMEVVVFLHDAVMTMSSFFEIYPPAAAIFLSAEPAKDRNFLFTLSRVHDQLLPSIRKQPVEEEFSSHLNKLQREVVNLAWSIFSNCFFEGTGTPSGEVFMDALVGLSSGSDGANMLHSLSSMFDLGGNVHRVLQSGLICLDDSQYAQLLFLLPDLPLTEDKTRSVSVLNASDEKDEEDAIRQSHITQIKDLFPDYEDGFLSACLEVYDNNPEVVIQHILDGSVHPDITSALTISKSGDSKGKGKVLDEEKRTVKSGKGKGKVMDEADSSQKRQGRFVRKFENNDEDASKLLNERDAGTSSQTAHLAMQLMYEDEYDDSFDDLDTNVADAGLETDSLVNLFSRNKLSDAFDDAQKFPSQKQETSARPPRKQDTPRFFVKDGKHYNYKVAGAVAVSSLEEAEALRKEEEGLIHGLGRGGNVPINIGEDSEGEPDKDDETSNVVDGFVPSQHPAGNRGRGRPVHWRQIGSRKNHNKKDLSLKKHMSALRGN